jgi:hypothetical protein
LRETTFFHPCFEGMQIIPKPNKPHKPPALSSTVRFCSCFCHRRVHDLGQKQKQTRLQGKVTKSTTCIIKFRLLGTPLPARVAPSTQKLTKVATETTKQKTKLTLPPPPPPPHPLTHHAPPSATLQLNLHHARSSNSSHLESSAQGGS